MDITNILPFLCGSLVATMIFTIFVWRQGVMDDRLVRHIRSNAYNKGWKDGRNAQFNESSPN